MATSYKTQLLFPLALGLLLILLIDTAIGYPTGNITEACTSQIPNHNVIAQPDDTVPYKITLNPSTYAPGSEIIGKFK